MIISARLLWAAAAAALLDGCATVLGDPPAFAFDLVLRVASDDGTPVAGAEILVDGIAPRSTDADGGAPIRVVGHEGDRRAATVRCPADYQSPAQPLVFSLRRGAAGARPPIYDATCVPLARTVVLGVRLERGPHLPVYYLGETVGRTDESGAAHVLIHVPQGEPFRVSIGTASDPALRPIDPQRDFAVGGADDIVVFDQKFTRIEKPAPPPPRRRLPTHL